MRKRLALNIMMVFMIAVMLYLSPTASVCCYAKEEETPEQVVMENETSEMNLSKIREPIRQEALTDEQEQEGWELIGGYAVPPELLQGQAGLTAGDVREFSAGQELVNVTFMADIPAGQTEPFILYFTNADNYREYYIELYASNSYTTTVRMPAGAYYFTGGGPENDYTAMYTVSSPDAFIVESGKDMVINPVIRPKGGFMEEKQEAESSVEAADLTETAEASLDNKNNWGWKTYLEVALLFAIIGAITYGWWKMKSRKEES